MKITKLSDERFEELRLRKIETSRAHYLKKRDNFSHCDICNKEIRTTEFKVHQKSKKHLFYCLPVEEQQQVLNGKKEIIKKRKREQAREFYKINFKDRMKNYDEPNENIVVENFSTEYIV
jgi:hypothetical protein